MNRPWLRWALLVLALKALIIAAVLAPLGLRRLDAFRVQRVAVLGTRYLAPHAALATSGITGQSSVFDDPDDWRAALLAHPMIADVRIERRLPGSVRITIVETEPIALALTPELRVVDAEGRLLPIRPAGQELDLPILAEWSGITREGRLASEETRALLANYDRVRTLQPALAARVSEIHAAGRDGIRLVLRAPGAAEALLPADAGVLRLREVQLAIADLAARSELDRLHRLDARYRDQVVVLLIPSTAEG